MSGIVDMSKTRITIQVSVDPQYKHVLDFYSERVTLGKFFNAMLAEVARNKSLKFKLLKDVNKASERVRLDKL